MAAKVINITEARARRDAPKPFDLTGHIIAFEDRTLDEAGVIELFQHLVNTGLAWRLQGSYGRTANDLIQAGHVTVPQVAK